MKRLYTILMVSIIFLVSGQIYAQLLTRTAEIREPAQLERGFGGVVAGVDFDGDGLPEIYACNTNMIDEPYELIPRLYKFEWNPSTATWDSVWGVISEVPLQNTWPALTYGDLDKDGKMEIHWGIVNNLDATLNPNPARIIVYEYPGDGTNNMGVADGFGGFLPNAKYTMTDQLMFNLRPIKFQVADIDNDNKNELIVVDRQSGTSNFHVGVYSVDDIPDQGTGFETWTAEFTGLTDVTLANTGHKWDMSVVPPYICLWAASGATYLIKYANNSYTVYPGQTQTIGANGSFKGSAVAKLDNEDVVVVGGWFNSKVYAVSMAAGVDTLTWVEVADLAPLGAIRLNGAGVGDIDANGKPDFIFGSRYMAATTVNVPIFRVEYQGGGYTNPANWTTALVDSGYWTNNGDMDVIVVANVDGDPADEVMYTQGYSRGNALDAPMPLIVLDKQFTPVSAKENNSLVPASIYLADNYPNPFNPSTRINFGLSSSATVDLRVYDMLGREVAVLVNNQFMNAGNHTIGFNANGLASGVYFYKLKSANTVITKKMQLMK